MDKPFKTYDELLDFLEKEKELNIPDREKAKHVLAKISYYSLVTGYKDIFKDKTTGYYKPDVVLMTYIVCIDLIENFGVFFKNIF